MADEKHNISTSDASKIEALIEQVNNMDAGDLKSVFEADFESPLLVELVTKLNRVRNQCFEREEQFHGSTMELALALSECFAVLSEVQKGNFASRVSDQTLHSENDIVAKLGETVNATIADIESRVNTIEKQRAAIRELSTPIIQVWEGILCLPVVGVVDTSRSNEMMETLLEGVVKHGAKCAIIDITGVDVVDTRAADHFIKMVQATKLLGVKCIITGIKPEIAQTIVEIGVDLSAMTTLRTLREGLLEGFRQLRVTFDYSK